MHIIGEETFLRTFRLEPLNLFFNYLRKYLKEEYSLDLLKNARPTLDGLAQLIEKVESLKKVKGTSKGSSKKRKLKENTDRAKPSESEFYNKAKELKKSQDRELREKLKKASPLKESQAYQEAKEQKRIRDKELREKLKSSNNVSKSIKLRKHKSAKLIQDKELYEKAKEAKRQRDKELRQKLKKQKAPSKSITQSDFYQKAKEARKQRDKELRKQQKELRKRLSSKD